MLVFGIDAQSKINNPAQYIAPDDVTRGLHHPGVKNIERGALDPFRIEKLTGAIAKVKKVERHNGLPAWGSAYVSQPPAPEYA